MRGFNQWPWKWQQKSMSTDITKLPATNSLQCVKKHSVTHPDQTLLFTRKSVCVKALQWKLDALTIYLEKWPLRSLSTHVQRYQRLTDFKAKKLSRHFQIRFSVWPVGSFMWKPCRGIATEMSHINFWRWKWLLSSNSTNVRNEIAINWHQNENVEPCHTFWSDICGVGLLEKD